MPEAWILPSEPPAAVGNWVNAEPPIPSPATPSPCNHPTRRPLAQVVEQALVPEEGLQVGGVQAQVLVPRGQALCEPLNSCAAVAPLGSCGKCCTGGAESQHALLASARLHPLHSTTFSLPSPCRLAWPPARGTHRRPWGSLHPAASIHVMPSSLGSRAPHPSSKAGGPAGVLQARSLLLRALPQGRRQHRRP